MMLMNLGSATLMAGDLDQAQPLGFNSRAQIAGWMASSNR
jgi:hypothetical protein